MIVVDTDALLPFDVLLTRGKGKPSRLIAEASSGTYSHAVICLSGTNWFDAREEGTGNVSEVEPSANGLLVRDAERGVVLRHPLVDLLSLELLEQLETDLKRTAVRLSGIPYANLERLLSLQTASSTSVLIRIMRALGKHVGQLTRPLGTWVRRSRSSAALELSLLDGDARRVDTDPGYYCSELVALLLVSFGLHPWYRGVAISHSPNAFVDANLCTLREVVDAVRPATEASLSLADDLDDEDRQMVAETLALLAESQQPLRSLGSAVRRGPSRSALAAGLDRARGRRARSAWRNGARDGLSASSLELNRRLWVGRLASDVLVGLRSGRISGNRATIERWLDSIEPSLQGYNCVAEAMYSRADSQRSEYRSGFDLTQERFAELDPARHRHALAFLQGVLVALRRALPP